MDQRKMTPSIRQYATSILWVFLLWSCTPVEVDLYGDQGNIPPNPRGPSNESPSFTPLDAGRPPLDLAVNPNLDQMPPLRIFDTSIPSDPEDQRMLDQTIELPLDLSLPQMDQSMSMMTPLECNMHVDCPPYICQCRNGNSTLFQACVDNQCISDDFNICNDGGACNGQGGAQSARPYQPFSGGPCVQPEECPIYSCICQDQTVNQVQICLNGLCLASDQDCRTWDIESQFLERSDLSCVPRGGSL